MPNMRTLASPRPSLSIPLILTPSIVHISALQFPSSPRGSSFSPSLPIHLASRGERFHSLRSQKRPENNVSGDTDEMYDDLLDKYGKVVFRRTDQKTPIAEADDDAESLSFVVALAEVACEVKAADIKVLFVKPLVYWTRFFIIATAFSRPQIDAMGSKIRDIAEKKFKKFASGDSKPNSWTLLDFGDVVVHIFLPQQRAFYNLEEFYGNAVPIELPFDSESSFRN
ncbi:protein Iojap, chloroplastic [Aristolochia californica]|uniref:protein Iojap, chloroplastic n=1 Tax=Aristolochia californica TaxID=171875 RepID=UPI0035DE5B70